MESVIPCEPNGSRDSLLSPTDSQQAVDYRNFCYKEQRSDDFCFQVLTEYGSRHRHFHEGPDGILRRMPLIQPDLAQIVLHKVLRPSVIPRCHYSRMPGHLGLNRMYYHTRQIYYWPHMAADVTATVRNCVPSLATGLCCGSTRTI